MLLTDTVAAAGLDSALAPWRKPLAIHEAGKVVLERERERERELERELALTLALGGDSAAPRTPG